MCAGGNGAETGPRGGSVVRRRLGRRSGMGADGRVGAGERCAGPVGGPGIGKVFRLIARRGAPRRARPAPSDVGDVKAGWVDGQKPTKEARARECSTASSHTGRDGTRRASVGAAPGGHSSGVAGASRSRQQRWRSDRWEGSCRGKNGPATQRRRDGHVRLPVPGRGRFLRPWASSIRFLPFLCFAEVYRSLLARRPAQTGPRNKLDDASGFRRGCSSVDARGLRVDRPVTGQHRHDPDAAGRIPSLSKPQPPAAAGGGARRATGEEEEIEEGKMKERRV
ncbi:hypothetical protein C8Q78DRAFT_368480 [Trametes maxima]|nr:hypothetical protein C8Q78DRAFT_368480 [Trametes maxima]